VINDSPLANLENTGDGYYQSKITTVWESARDSIFQIGRLLVKAKASLPHGTFETMVRSELPFGERSARRFMAISNDPRLSNRTHGSDLPNSWRTLYELTKLTDDQFKTALQDGTINPDMDRKDVVNRIRDRQRGERLETIMEANTDLPGDKHYQIIYADPPWRYENPPMGGSNRSIENHYPTMTLEDICALPVGDLAAEDALLYLWATAPKLAECMQVIEAWGFQYRTNMVWDKVSIGMGYHARNQHELLLIARRGSIPPPLAGTQASSVHVEKRGKHSAKPHFYYEMIEAAYSGLEKIELFARAPRVGWTVHGNQSESAA